MNSYAIYIFIKTLNVIKPYAFEAQLDNTESQTIAAVICDELADNCYDYPYDYKFISIIKIDDVINS
jgi:hypothetical protein